MMLILLTYPCGKLVFGRIHSTFYFGTEQLRSAVSSPGFKVIKVIIT